MQKQQRVALIVIGCLVVGAQSALASTGLSGLDNAGRMFQNVFLLGVFLLGFAGFATVAYTVARNRYGIIWDEALGIMKAVAVGAGAVTILGWAGSSAAAPMVPAIVTAFSNEILPLLP